MAKYPIKMLLDEKKNPFFPVVTIDSVLVNETEQTAADMFADRYTKAEIDKIIADLGTLQRLCGKVNSIEALPNNARPGDTYIVTGASGNNSEYMYIGDKWEELGPMVDLSGYDTSEEVDAKLSSLKDNVNETAETNSAEALKQAQQYADTKAATLATDALTDAKAYTDEVVAQAGTGASLKAVTVDNYTAGMEEANPILVVYKEAHTIDPTTDLLLATGSTLVSEKDSEVSYTIVGEPGVTRSTNYDIRMNNTSSNQYIRFNTVRFYVYDEYGTYLTDVSVSFNNTTDGSNIIAPNTESASATLSVPLNAAYVVVAEEQYETGIPMENPEDSGNVIVRETGIKELRDMVLEVESYENQIAVVKVTNPTENRIRYPQFNMIFRDYYSFDLHISETHDFTLNPGESRSFSMLTPIFYLAIFDTNTEIIPEVELQPYHMVPEVGNEVVAGDYKYKLLEFTINGNMSTVRLEVTNMLDFTVQPPIGKCTLGFHLFDKYGTLIADLIGYAPNTMVAGATQEIESSIDIDLSNTAYIEFDSTFFTHLDNATHLIPVEGSKIVTPDGALELEYVSHETVASTSTLHLKVTNLTDAEVPVDDRIILYNPIGTEIITLTIFAGMLDAGSSKVTSSSYGDNAIGKGLYYMEYRKESK